MAREKEIPQELEEAPPPKKGKKKIIMMVAVAVVLLGVSAFAYFLFFGEDTPPEKKAQQQHSERAIMSMEAFLVNLADKDVRRYLKIKIDLEVENEKAVKELEKFQPRIRDHIIFLLSSKTYQDISTPEGKNLLKKEIMAKMAAMPVGKKISAAYFTEFVAQ